MTRKSSGEIYAQIKAEAANPRGDIWWGGTGDPHLQAAEEGLTLEYIVADELAELQDWAVRQWEQSKEPHRRRLRGRARLRLQHRALQRRRSAEPKCWADLLDPKLKDEVQVADPNSSGTAYTLLATIVQLMGEEKGFDYLKSAPQERQPVHQVGRRAGEGGRPRRDADRHHLPCTTW